MASTNGGRKHFTNPPVGGSGGDSFEFFGQDDSWVQSIQVSTGPLGGGHDGLKAITVFLSNGDSQTFGKHNDDRHTCNFEQGEKVKEMYIAGGNGVDKIHISTDQKTWEKGGDGGVRTPQEIGDGILIGFCGRSGSDIDALGAIFEVK